MSCEESQGLIKSGAPHWRGWWSAQKIMLAVIACLVPSAAAGVFFFGEAAIWVLAAAVVSAWGTDILMQILTGRGLVGITWVNWSSVLTGLLLGMILPPDTRIWLPVIGSFFAVALGKYAFGKGNNIFNPALIARTFLVFAFPALMVGYIIPDGITSATPLSLLKEEGYARLVSDFGGKTLMHKAMLLGGIGGSIGETSGMMLLIGGIALIAMGITSWRIPAAYLGTVAGISLIAGRDALMDLLAGGLLLGAFFMATDYVTSPLTPKGKLIFGAGCGALTMLFRLYSGYPEGVAFSILLMNSAVPMIERYTKPKPFGYAKKKEKGPKA